MDNKVMVRFLVCVLLLTVFCLPLSFAGSFDEAYFPAAAYVEKGSGHVRDFVMAVCGVSCAGAKDLCNRDSSAGQVYGQIQDIARKALAVAGKNADAVTRVRALNKVIYDDYGFKALDGEYDPLMPSAIVFPSMFDSRTGNCLGLSMLYLCAGSLCGLHLYGVACPEHFFVRVRLENGKMLNIETTSRGVFFDDAEYKTGKKHLAESYFKSLSLPASCGVYMSALGHMYTSRSYPQRALKLCRVGVRANNLLPETVGYFAQALFMRKKYRASTAAYKKALEISPHNPLCHANLATSYFAQGLYSGAVHEFSQALKTDRTKAGWHYGLGCAHQALGKNRKAARSFKKALELDPANGKYMRNFAYALVQAGNYRQAAEMFVRAAKVCPEDPTCMLSAARSFEKAGRSRDALRWYEKACRRFPGSFDAHFGLAQQLFDGGDYAACVIEFEKAAKCDPLQSIVWTQMGVAYDKMGQSAKAQSAYKKALQLNPASGAAAYNLALMNLEQKNYAKAVDLFKTAAIKVKDPANCYNNIGFCFAQMDRPDMAHGYYLKAVKADPGYGLAHANLSGSYARKGDAKRAAYHDRMARKLERATQA